MFASAKMPNLVWLSRKYTRGCGALLKSFMTDDVFLTPEVKTTQLYLYGPNLL